MSPLRMDRPAERLRRAACMRASSRSQNLEWGWQERISARRASRRWVGYPSMFSGESGGKFGSVSGRMSQ